MKLECSKCGGTLFWEKGLVLTSYPPQKPYECVKCGNTETVQGEIPSNEPREIEVKEKTTIK